METKFASAERVSQENLENDKILFDNHSTVKEILNSLPHIAAILNEQRQIVYSNNALLELLNVNTVEELLGYRPGEAVNCIHSNDEKSGCGTSESCKYCGAVKTILKCQQAKAMTKDECRIASNINGNIVNHDFLVSAAPLSINGRQFIILSLTDISSDKRKQVLERIFFHDVINTSGTLLGLINLMKDADDEQLLKKYIDLADNTSKELVEEIVSQRELMAAENNELQISRGPVFSIDLIRDVVVKILYNPISKDRSVIIDKNSTDITFTTDVRLLKRVLVNMLKNALEATSEQGKVKIGCSHNSREATIWVSNPAFIPRDIQLQIFLRSFSTKGHNRGLGTYSMKLLTERYLGGKISFETNEKNGTKFFVRLPL